MMTMAYDQGVSRELKLFGVHEPVVTKSVQAFLAKGMQCMEIGANLGYYTLLESSAIGSSGGILALEPIPTTFGYLRRNIELNRISNIQSFQLAIGDRDGTAKMVVSTSSNLSHVRDENLAKSKPSGAPVLEVRMLKLDTLCEEKSIRKLDFLRMDVEGYEYAVIQGGLVTLEKLKPLMLVEFHVAYMGPLRSVSVLQVLKNLGYEIAFCVPRYRDFPPVSSVYRNPWRIQIAEFIRGILNGQLTSDYNVLFQHV